VSRATKRARPPKAAKAEKAAKPSKPARPSRRATPCRRPAGPLAGFRVVELCHHLVGPLASMYLADLGADVIKVETIEGDPRRYLAPTLGSTLSTQFLALNRNKASVALNLGSRGGRDALDRLLATADVFISNLSSESLERKRLDHRSLERRHPRLIAATLTAYGTTGPQASRRGFDINLCGESGLWLEGADGRPRSNASPVVDTAGAMLFALGVVAALLGRERTKQVRRVETDLMSVCMALMAHRLVWMDGSPAPDLSPTVRSADAYAALYTYFETADGWLSVGAVSEALFSRFLRALGMESIRNHPRHATWEAILDDQSGLRELIAPRLKARSTSHWCRLLARHKIPVGRVFRGAEVWRHPQLVSSRAFERARHPSVGRYTAMASPLRHGGARPGTVSAAPVLGQHTVPVLRSLAFTPAEVERLVRDGAARSAP
jgi:crotonobetainyl-CoA:carnitine CoA-transferase CaiB-like acyl-CoA transferase